MPDLEKAGLLKGGEEYAGLGVDFSSYCNHCGRPWLWSHSGNSCFYCKSFVHYFLDQFCDLLAVSSAQCLASRCLGFSDNRAEVPKEGFA